MLESPGALHPYRCQCSGRLLPGVLLATALILPTSPVAAAGPGTLALGGLSLDAITIPEPRERMQAGGLTAVGLTQAYSDRIAEVDDYSSPPSFAVVRLTFRVWVTTKSRRTSGPPPWTAALTSSDPPT
ncbi:hypothetical protein [Mycobacterium sp. IDR2000157661]|uniref:hypothetical protein n=1 Tax=Mycobacterium sp. IDR2000157661 TaxID=2867005 RepID=UPI001EEAD2E4|nr:hypothetical protein [Mycobacterium sp. IDR2000157661]ULE33462.1 hypothetical protein K3G64_01730 [Mycobacterium sp. IDR2000157661]